MIPFARHQHLLALLAISAVSVCPTLAQQSAPDLSVSTLPRLGTVSDRFQSYNIEMLEVTGGRFWKPYASTSAPSTAAAPGTADTPAGMSPDLYAYRPPEDLGNARLRRLAAALGPAYVRVSGTWQNTTYFPTADESSSKPPAGFNTVLTRAEWKGVIDFAHNTNSEIVTSFSISPGTRDAQGTWTPDQAKRMLDYTRSIHGQIAAAEFMNEPTIPSIGGAPKGYDAQQFGRDFHAFERFIRAEAPEIKIAGPGSVGENTDAAHVVGGSMPGFLPTPDLLQAMGRDTVDIFSYHSYAGVSQRCASLGAAQQTTAEDALSEQWLSRPDSILAFYKHERDQFDPGKPLWVTETADTACGGNPWASTFLDSFRYLDQLGRLAKGGVQVMMHNTLDASDYGLLEENTYLPRPNYWAALLWRKLMGSTVLDAGIPNQPGLHVYAHCLRDTPGGVALLVIQTDQTSARHIHIPLNATRYTLSAPQLQSRSVSLNGTELKLSAGDQLPALNGLETRAGLFTFAPATITFLALPSAANAACR